MRLDINLASQPYEDARQFWMRWGTAVGAVGVLTIFLLTLTITGWFSSRRDHRAMAEKRALIAERDQKRAEAEKTLNLPQNRSTRDTSQFLNELIERKAFSWTQVLENLEKMMPPRVHLVSISPELNDDNELMLKMSVAGNSRDRALELARHMEESRQFAQTNITGETDNLQGNNGDTEKFDMISVYIPATLPAPDVSAPAPEKTDAKPKTTTTPAATTTTAPKTAATPPNTTTQKPITPKPAPPKGPTH
jgi:type IV pilus assembly protein PilN